CALMIGSVLLFTPLEIGPASSGNTLPALSVAFFLIFLLGLMEEIVFRSYPLFRLDDAVGTRTAIYVTSVAFAFYHGLDASNLLGPGVWGLFYGWMALKTDSIALPTGFHVGLNYMQALFGMKPKYGGALWELEIGTQPGVLGAETLGFGLQIVLLAIGVVLVERLIRQRHSDAHTGREASES
ncbi:MAG: CPBP family intramembrane glutamic endopeptidase, partial [Pseudomonadota bacterium]